jgi:hypothetical protein
MGMLGQARRVPCTVCVLGHVHKHQIWPWPDAFSTNAPKGTTTEFAACIYLSKGGLVVSLGFAWEPAFPVATRAALGLDHPSQPPCARLPGGGKERIPAPKAFRYVRAMDTTADTQLPCRLAQVLTLVWWLPAAPSTTIDRQALTRSPEATHRDLQLRIHHWMRSRAGSGHGCVLGTL